MQVFNKYSNFEPNLIVIDIYKYFFYYSSKGYFKQEELTKKNHNLRKRNFCIEITAKFITLKISSYYSHIYPKSVIGNNM